MAKINSLVLRKAKGKLAGTTIYTTEGETIMREVNESPKNPQTEAQMKHRVKLSNLVNGYRFLKPWLQQAFPKGKAMVSFYNMFVGKNLTDSSIYLPKDVAAAGVFIPSYYKVADGTLNVPVENTTSGSSTAHYLNVLPVATDFEIGEDTTVGDLSTALLTATPTLKQGDQIAVVVVKYNKADGKNSMSSQSFIVDAENDTRVADYFADLVFNINAHRLQVQMSLNSTTDEVVGAYAVVSRRSNSGIEVTPAKMQTNLQSAFNTAQDLEDAIESYTRDAETVALDPEEAEIIIK